MTARFKPRQWDIFCKVIDNFGDIGVCWRLATGLASHAQSVRLWVDDARALRWMAPGAWPGVEVLAWPAQLLASDLAKLGSQPSGVVVEAFGCDAAPEFIAACASLTRASGIKPLWINLEYLSSEAYVERCHGLPSPIASGPAAGWTKFFFYPGFTPRTGGLLREENLQQRQAGFNSAAWLQQQGIAPNGPAHHAARLSLFCYEPAALPALLGQLMRHGFCNRPAHLLVAAGRAERAVKRALEQAPALLKPSFSGEKGFLPTVDKGGMLSISYLPLLTQTDFDHLLWSCDLNFVRGEDSLVRAIWAGKPFVWQIYPQDDGAHAAKLDAFLDTANAPASWRAFHHRWSQQAPAAGGTASAANSALVQSPVMDLQTLHDWAAAAAKLRRGLLAQPDLSTQLLMFAENKAKIAGFAAGT